LALKERFLNSGAGVEVRITRNGERAGIEVRHARGCPATDGGFKTAVQHNRHTPFRSWRCQ